MTFTQKLVAAILVNFEYKEAQESCTSELWLRHLTLISLWWPVLVFCHNAINFWDFELLMGVLITTVCSSVCFKNVSNLTVYIAVAPWMKKIPKYARQCLPQLQSTQLKKCDLLLQSASIISFGREICSISQFFLLLNVHFAGFPAAL